MRSKVWKEEELQILKDAIETGRSSWDIAKELAPKLDRTIRAVDTKIRDLKMNAVIAALPPGMDNVPVTLAKEPEIQIEVTVTSVPEEVSDNVEYARYGARVL